MQHRTYALSVLLAICLSDCKKTATETPPPPEQVMVHTAISGQLKYTLLSMPAPNVKVMACARKFLYYRGNDRIYTGFTMDSTRTDSAGNFSMSFTADSFGCDYFLYIPQYYTDMRLGFPAGDSTAFPLTYLLKTAEVKVYLIVQNNFNPPLYVLNNAVDTGYALSIWPDSLRMYTSVYVGDSIGYIFWGYRHGTEMRRKTDTFQFHSLTDTAMRTFICDPSTF